MRLFNGRDAAVEGLEVWIGDNADRRRNQVRGLSDRSPAAVQLSTSTLLTQGQGALSMQAEQTQLHGRSQFQRGAGHATHVLLGLADKWVARWCACLSLS